MASSPSWIFQFPKQDICHLSIFPAESIKIIKLRKNHKLILLAKSSLHGESNVDSEDLNVRIKKKEVEIIRTDLSTVISAVNMKSVKRKWSPIILWRRIFFASKKVRSIILLNILSVVYATWSSYKAIVAEAMARSRRDSSQKECRSMRVWCSPSITKSVWFGLYVGVGAGRFGAVWGLNRFRTASNASNIPVVKEVEQMMDPALFTVVRFGFTAIPFLPFILKEHNDSKIRAAGLELGLWVSLGYHSQTLGLLTSEAGQASFITAFTIVVVPIIDGLSGATVPALTWTGALVSLLGVGILEYGGSPPCVGDVLNIMSAVFFAVHIFRTEQISRSTNKEKFLALLGYQVSVLALSSALWFMCEELFSEVHQLNIGSGVWHWSQWWGWIVSFPWVPAIYTGVFSTGVCLWVEMDAMRNVSATETAIVYGLEPLWGAAFAWFLLGERWDTTEWVGAALILCGSLAVQLLGTSSEESSNEEGSNKKDLSISTIAIKTKTDDHNLYRKQDKL